MKWRMAYLAPTAITRDADYQPPERLEDSIVVSDYMKLVNRYRDSDEELLIVGGATIFKLVFTLCRETSM